MRDAQWQKPELSLFHSAAAHLKIEWRSRCVRWIRELFLLEGVCFEPFQKLLAIRGNHFRLRIMNVCVDKARRSKDFVIRR